MHVTGLLSRVTTSRRVAGGSFMSAAWQQISLFPCIREGPDAENGAPAAQAQAPGLSISKKGKVRPRPNPGERLLRGGWKRPEPPRTARSKPRAGAVRKAGRCPPARVPPSLPPLLPSLPVSQQLLLPPQHLPQLRQAPTPQRFRRHRHPDGLPGDRKPAWPRRRHNSGKVATSGPAWAPPCFRKGPTAPGKGQTAAPPLRFRSLHRPRSAPVMERSGSCLLIVVISLYPALPPRDYPNMDHQI
ncbi:uncharacterized protein LOC133370036 [Rhineura floridana]|uniref:uncharacterized protein LOC133370036 n=1 Tax=Rhineura floridana TaxID=261503 RepID=UPI002AC7F9A8|nr:uncharacterized protein LOC133370036 [Rhineura floridana]